MRRLRYDERPRHRLRLEGGEFVYGGQEFEVADEVAERLIADPHIPVTQLATDDVEGSTQTEENL